MRTRSRLTLLLLAGILAAGSPVALAQPPGAPQTPVVVPTAGGEVTILADRLEEVGPEKLLVATGNVEITRNGTRLMADRVEIDRESGAAVAQGRVVFYDGDDQLTGRRIDYNLKTGTGVVYAADARVAPYYHISGERMERLGESVYTVRRGIFTTCEDDPPSWSFRFGSGTADLDDFVYGTDASFWVKGLPLIPFLPFFAAAIRRERQTGFLIPKVGQSSRKGFFAEVPFYWAISDSQDATIAPLYYERRGPGLDAEYRYVLSADQKGSMSGFVIQEISKNDNTRAVGSFRHDWRIAPGLEFKADVNGVTNDNVLSEYGDQLHQRSAQRVESNVFLTRRTESWDLVANVFWYQDLTTHRPVELQRVPDLSVLGVRQPMPGLPGVLYEADASLVHFMREVGSNGTRVDLHPRLSRPISADGLFTVTPFVGGRVTAYDKTVTGFRTTRAVTGPIEVTDDEPRVRRLAEAGTDVEMTLSRVYEAGGRLGAEALLHTIEPRVNYTWIGGEGQDRLPIWTEGVDRIDDTSRVTYSLTNRIRGRTVTLADTEPVRWELLRFVLGHSYDLRNDREGDAFTTLILAPSNKLRFRGDLAYNVPNHNIPNATADVSATLPFVTTSVGVRYSDPGKVNFLQAGVATDIWRNVVLRANTNWDMRTDTFVESRFGVDIRFQCWAIAIEYVNRARHDDEMRFAVNLLGVGGPFTTSVGLGAIEGPRQR
ncbi:MAG TPA: LPS assembly protein LptD [Methylomirabilota bacterium]|nr:LPS assembly protein LptD [Methylomirabilota bacterium]